MPFVNFVTSVKLTGEAREQVRDAIFEAIQLVPGKTPEVTMVEVRDGAFMQKGTSGEPAIFVETRVFTRPTFDAKRAYVQALSKKLNALTGVDESRMYFNILEFFEWGSGGDYRSF